jgi:hypothetical protein
VFIAPPPASDAEEVAAYKRADLRPCSVEWMTLFALLHMHSDACSVFSLHRRWANPAA